MTVTLDDRFKLRRGTAANLATVNEVPFEGEIVYETDQGLADGKYKIKIGDGVTSYNDLPYISLGGGVESIVPGSHISVDTTDPKNPVVGVSSLTVSSSYAEGTAFPTSPAPSLDDKFYRTDLNLLCYYDGARWLTVHEYTCDFTGSNTLGSGTGNVSYGSPPGGSIYVTRWYFSSRVVSPNSPSSYWTFTLTYTQRATGATVTLASVDTHLLNYATLVFVPLSVVIESICDASIFVLSLSKTGSPGATYNFSSIAYRRVVT